MAEIQPETMKGATLNIAAENRAQLKQLFPTVFTETRNDKGELTESIDFEKLKAELGTFSDTFESRRERYGMEWPGKKEALHLIQSLSSATLKPCRQESVNFDTTENLFIEGDNLEVLKLLQTSYYGKVKMIYIDPPYNTGKEFIYPDNFSESLETYLEYAGLIDGKGKKFSTNTANEGRFHTKWLNMIYPRLYLARNLLRDDGVIFISIDDNEVSNLRKMCDEIFGEENFVAVFPWKKRTTKSDVPFGVSQDYEWIVAFTKGELQAGVAYERKYYQTNDFTGDRWRLSDLTKQTAAAERPNSAFDMLDPKTGKLYPFNPQRVWAVTEDTFPEYYRKGKIVFPDDYDFLNITIPAFRVFESEDKVKAIRKFGSDEAMKAVSTFLPKEIGMNENGNKEMLDLFGSKLFSFPKPVSFVKYFVSMISDTSAIVLDFFAGSATTAHAVLDLNKQDNGSRKFILVQLPEPCTPESEAFKAGYNTIADIGKERIRRVINKLNTEQEGKLDLDNAGKQDRGFKVLKLDKSNFRQWQKLEPSASTEQILDQLSLHIDHIDPKAAPEELLYEILLKAGFTLTGTIETKTISGKELFSVSDGALLLCLEESVTNELIDAVIELNPQQFLCLDRAFHGNDQLKANAVQTFNAHNMQKKKHNQILFKTV
jgi:adenine-specific DNA-methyltransferase